MTDLTKAFGQHAPRTGEFMRTPEQIAKDNRAAELRSMGWSYQQIGESMGMTKQGAHLAVKRAVAEIPKEGAEAVLKMELAKLDRVERYYNSVLAKTHLKVGNTGKIVLDANGEPLIDEQPRMAAADGLLKTSTQRAKLLGLNAPTSIKGELVVYDVDRDSTKIIEAQLEALRAMGLHDRVDEFREQFLAALGSSEGQVIDAEWSAETLAVPGPEL
jgi:hypothetical protein